MHVYKGKGKGKSKSKYIYIPLSCPLRLACFLWLTCLLAFPFFSLLVSFLPFLLCACVYVFRFRFFTIYPSSLVVFVCPSISSLSR